MVGNFYKWLGSLLFLGSAVLAQAQDSLTIRIERGCYGTRSKIHNSYYGHDLKDNSWVMLQDVEVWEYPELGDTLVLRVEQVPKDSTVFCNTIYIKPDGTPMDETARRYYRVLHPIGENPPGLVPYWEGIHPDSTHARRQSQQQNR